MPEPKAQLIDPQGPIDVPGMQVTGVTTATGGFVGQVQGAATGLASTTANLSVGIVTATKFQGNTTGNVSGLADDTNINVGIITSTSFTGDLVGNAAGLSTTTANIKAGIMSATSFAGNFTGVASGITCTPNIVVGIMTGTLNGDGSTLTGIAATNWITNNVTANSSTTTVNLSLGNVVKFTQSADTTVSFANTGTSNIVSFIRVDDNSGTDRTITWPSSIKWTGGEAPTLINNTRSSDAQVFTLLTRDEGVTWQGWETVNVDLQPFSAWGWGQNQYGNLGQNNTTSYSSPKQVGSDTNWSSLSHGLYHTGSAHGIKNDGTLWVWGYNLKGGLGTNNRTYYSSPVQIPGTTWSTVGKGSRNAFAVKTDGTMWTWGQNPYGALGLNEGSTSSYYSSPVQIPGTTWSSEFTNSYYQSMAIKTDGTLWTWGSNQHGVLGTNNNTQRSSPTQIPGSWSKVARNYFYSGGAIKTGGTLWMWGRNTKGNLGTNNTTQYNSPVQVPGTTWANISCDQHRTLGSKTDGTLWAWGEMDQGTLGLNQESVNISSPVQIPGTTWDTKNFFISDRLVAAMKTDGTLWTWGSNSQGGLGQNNKTKYSSPTQVPGTSWAKIYEGNSGMMALQKAG